MVYHGGGSILKEISLHYLVIIYGMYYSDYNLHVVL
jgi:hypothetical protein